MVDTERANPTTLCHPGIRRRRQREFRHRLLSPTRRRQGRHRSGRDLGAPASLFARVGHPRVAWRLSGYITNTIGNSFQSFGTSHHFTAMTEQKETDWTWERLQTMTTDEIERKAPRDVVSIMTTLSYAAPEILELVKARIKAQLADRARRLREPPNTTIPLVWKKAFQK